MQIVKQIIHPVMEDVSSLHNRKNNEEFETKQKHHIFGQNATHIVGAESHVHNLFPIIIIQILCYAAIAVQPKGSLA